MTVACPKCASPSGIQCLGTRGYRKAPHKLRYDNFQRNGSLPLAKPKKKAAPIAPVERPVGFYLSDEWRDVRYRALLKHGGACQCCGATPSPGRPLHVDHIKPRSKFPELGLDISNLQILCVDCNLGKRAWDQTDWRRA